MIVSRGPGRTARSTRDQTLRPQILIPRDCIGTHRLDCTLTGGYRDFLRRCGGIGTQGAVLYGVDDPSNDKARNWPGKGIVYGSLTSLRDPKKSQWIVVGENEFEVYAVARSGTRCAKLDHGTEALIEEFSSLETMLCECLDRMIKSNAHNRKPAI